MSGSSKRAGNAGILAEGVEFLDEMQVDTQFPGRRRRLGRGFFPRGGRQPAMDDGKENLARDAVPTSAVLAFLAGQQRGESAPPSGVQALRQGREEDRFNNSPHQAVSGDRAAVAIEDGGDEVNPFTRALVLIFDEGEVGRAPADIEVQDAGLGHGRRGRARRVRANSRLAGPYAASRRKSTAVGPPRPRPTPC